MDQGLKGRQLTEEKKREGEGGDELTNPLFALVQETQAKVITLQKTSQPVYHLIKQPLAKCCSLMK